ncbi:MAG: CNP1-like family protein [Pararobbsia sp.]
MPGANASGADGEQSTFEYLFDRKSVFKEEKVDTLPPLPSEANLLPFEVSKQSALVFAIDDKSVSIGKEDRVIRYTVVITSPAGARNVRYEGIRCNDGQLWRLYAAIDEDGGAWDRGTDTNWEKIEGNELNAYHAALVHDYFCNFSIPNGSAKAIVENIRYRRTINEQNNR